MSLLASLRDLARVLGSSEGAAEDRARGDAAGARRLTRRGLFLGAAGLAGRAGLPEPARAVTYGFLEVSEPLDIVSPWIRPAEIFVGGEPFSWSSIEVRIGTQVFTGFSRITFGEFDLEGLSEIEEDD